MNRTMRKRIQDLIPAVAVHPGEHIRDEIKAMGLSQAELARKMGIQRSLLNEVIKGQRNLSAKHAILLEKVLGIAAEYWINLQSHYDLSKARIEKSVQQRKEAIEKWESVKAYIPHKYYRKQKVLTGDPVQDMDTVKNIFNSAEVKEIQEEYVTPAFARFRKSEKLKVDEVNVLGWSKLAEYKAKSIDVASFNSASWPDLESQLRDVIRKNKEVRKKAKKVLQDFGIKLLYQEKAEKAPIDGYAFWSGDNPAIALTMRHKRLDYFAFTLYHELGHVFLHLVNDKSREVIDLYRYDSDHKKSKEEQEANSFAEDHLIPKKAWEKFFNKPSITEKDLIQFAKKQKTHPAIVLGRISHHTGHYAINTGISKTIN